MDLPQEGTTVVTKAGGKHSFILARYDCIPPICQRLLAQCLGFGAQKYGKNNWHQIPIEENLGHCLNHINEFFLGNQDEPHLVNALARLNFALHQAVESGMQAEQYVHPDMRKAMVARSLREMNKPTGESGVINAAVTDDALSVLE